ncbi:Unannotated [Lentimonas sp. CC19]|nr:Unannotated [Lentimonas sp. CC19]CAA6693443.1 Unannotated [Lentimonas sp. CC10]CAA7070772.1 Unannotated [Lentimonas sp. CC11]
MNVFVRDPKGGGGFPTFVSILIYLHHTRLVRIEQTHYVRITQLLAFHPLPRNVYPVGVFRVGELRALHFKEE